jgi:hypothetical protein
MVRINYNELDKVTFVAWVDKALDAALSKRNIKNGFQVTRIWACNPKATDVRIKPSELYVADRNNNTLDEDNEKNFDETINDTEGWGEDGVATYVINIATTTNDIATTKIDVDG